MSDDHLRRYAKVDPGCFRFRDPETQGTPIPDQIVVKLTTIDEEGRVHDTGKRHNFTVDKTGRKGRKR